MNKDWSNKIRLYGNIVVPSGISLSLSIGLSLITLFIYHLHIFLNYLDVRGNIGIGSYIINHINKLLSFVFGNNNIDNVVLLIFWASIGLIVYYVARIVLRDLDEFSLDVTGRNKFLWPRNSHPNILQRFFERFLFSLATSLVLVIYCAHILSFFLRGRVLTFGFLSPQATHWLYAHSIINQAIFVISEIIALHVVVVLLRLIFMRSRLFS